MVRATHNLQREITMKRIHITPEGTFLDGKLTKPDYIIISLPDGTSVDIETAIKTLTKKLPKPSRFGAALKALRNPPPRESPNSLESPGHLESPAPQNPQNQQVPQNQQSPLTP